MIQHVNTVFTCFIIVMCLVFAYFVTFTSLLSDRLQGNSRIIFVGLMLAYAVFRSYRLMKTIREHNKNPE